MADEHDSDLELLRDWQAGGATAGNRLCRRYQDKLRRFFEMKVPPHEVDEMVQQTWLAMSQARQRWQVDGGTAGTATAHEPSSFPAYLFGIARHLVIGFYAGRGRVKGVVFDPEVESLVALEPSISRQLSLQREVQWVEVALHSLPLDLQLLFEGRYLEDLSGAELAEIFGIPEGTVRSRLSRARRLLNEAIDGLKAGLNRPT